MSKIVLSEEKRIELIDETNKWIDENNQLAIKIVSLADRIAKIGLFQLVFSKKEDRQLFKEVIKNYREMNYKYLEENHKIEVNEKLLGIKSKYKGLIKTRH